MKIGLISCTSKKLDHKAPAWKLYQPSPLFNKAWKYCTTRYDKTYILSAKHGLLSPETEIEPYDVTLNKMPRTDRAIWASEIIPKLLTIATPEDILYIHAGIKYREFLLDPLRLNNISYEIPLKGKGIGEQLQFYNNPMLKPKLNKFFG